MPTPPEDIQRGMSSDPPEMAEAVKIGMSIQEDPVQAIKDKDITERVKVITPEPAYAISDSPPAYEPPTRSVFDMQKAPVYGISETAYRAPSKPRASAGTSWSPIKHEPVIHESAFVHPDAIVIGNVVVGADVFIAPGVQIRGDNDEPIYIGEGSYLQESAIIRDLPTRKDGKLQSQRVVEHENEQYSVYIGKNVVVSPQAQVHGPARVEDGAFIGMQALVFWAVVGKGVVVEPGSLIMNVLITESVFVPAGLKVTSNKNVNDLPPLTRQYRFFDLAAETIKDKKELLSGYKAMYESM
jgi:carbonic anhydrase/acetyltransferase-like protein (isoleucine patch superfamily)